MAPDALRVIKRLINFTWKAMCSKGILLECHEWGSDIFVVGSCTFTWYPTSAETGCKPTILIHLIYKVSESDSSNSAHLCEYIYSCYLSLNLQPNYLWLLKGSFCFFTLGMSLSCVLLLINSTKVASEPWLHLRHTHRRLYSSAQYNEDFLYFSVEKHF